MGLASENSCQFKMDSPIPKFSSMMEELIYFKKYATEWKLKAKETQQELEEFQETSREVESELEAQLLQLETKNRDLRGANSRLERDLDSTQDKLEKLQTDSIRQISDLQDDLCMEKKNREELTKYVRELEQANDDLERANRTTLCSLEDFDFRLNHAIERNAFLESELDEKESLVCSVQRLKDETRDLKQELSVTKSSPLTHTPYKTLPNNDRRAEKYRELKSEVDSPSPLHNGSPTTPLTPSARISALNIVGDLLRRVGRQGLKSPSPRRKSSSSSAGPNESDSALESKLASCRNFVKDVPPKLEKEENSATSPVKTPTVSRHLSVRRKLNPFARRDKGLESSGDKPPHSKTKTDA